jgi:methyltransferase (TIGR00027 family)
MALIRALEQAQPSSLRIIDDPYAAKFLVNPVFRFIAGSPLLSRLLLRLMSYWAPGGQELLTIRPRLVDDLASQLAQSGLKQIVILGAGFDTMAMRIKDYLRGVTVFEVDHPATQVVKRAAMGRIGEPANIRFVEVDFERDDFAEKLSEAGFDPANQSLIVWVGVSYYLTARAVARTLEQIATLSRTGTKLVWDYLQAEVIDGTTQNHDALDKARRAAQLGEPWLFGLKTDQVKHYLAQFGFELGRDYEPGELRARYCPRRQTPIGYVRIVVCERK